MSLKDAIDLANELIAEGHKEVCQEEWNEYGKFTQYRVHAVVNGVELYHINANREYPISL